MMIDLVSILKAICQRNRDALEYVPEGWVVAELYADLKKQASYTGWMPFDMEMPYVTLFPTKNPKIIMRDGTTRGGAKLADLCLYRDTDNIWHWIEFKASVFKGRKEYEKYYFDVFREDLIALRGFTSEDTADTWEYGHESINDYRSVRFQLPLRSNQLRTGIQHCTAVYIQVGKELDQKLWDHKSLLNQVQLWISKRQSQYGRKVLESLPDINLSQHPIDRDIWLVLAQW